MSKEILFHNLDAHAEEVLISKHTLRYMYMHKYTVVYL